MLTLAEKRNDANVRVKIGDFEGVVQFLQHDCALRIAILRPVGRYPGNLIGDFIANVLIGHVRKPFRQGAIQRL